MQKKCQKLYITSNHGNPDGLPDGLPDGPPRDGAMIPRDRDSLHRGVSPSQQIVLIYVMKNQDVIYSRATIARESGLPHDTVCKAFAALRRKGYIRNTAQIKQGVINGIHCTLDLDLCSEFLRYVGEDVGKVTDVPIRTLRRDDSSSGSSNNITTTGEEIVSRPTMAWWRETQKITAELIDTWSKQLKIDPETIASSLDHCRFDLVENRKLQTLNKSPISYFYGCLRRFRAYHPPAGYKSPAEMEIERIKAKILRSTQLEEASKEEMRLQIEMKLMKEFETFFADPSTDEYKYLEQQLPDFARQRGRNSSAYKGTLMGIWKSTRLQEGKG